MSSHLRFWTAVANVLRVKAVVYGVASAVVLLGSTGHMLSGARAAVPAGSLSSPLEYSLAALCLVGVAVLMWLAKPYLVEGRVWVRVIAGIVMAIAMVASLGVSLFALAIAYRVAPEPEDQEPLRGGMRAG